MHQWGVHDRKPGWRTTFRKPQCIDDGRGHKTGWGLSGIKVARRTHRLNPGLCKAGGGGEGGHGRG